MQRDSKILVVDKELAAGGKALTDFFAARRPAWRLTFARDAEEARSAVDSLKPDATVLAIEMTPGGREGFEILAKIRRDRPRTAVILIAESGDLGSVRDALMAPAGPAEEGAADHNSDGLLFRDEVAGEGGPEALECGIADGLFKYGRVPNERGVLITHGTDTLAWGLAYLRYALKDLTANIAVTGSMVPLEGYFSLSDALGNIKTSIYLLNRLRPSHLFAVLNNGRDVFSGRLTKYRKWDTDAFDGSMAASADTAGVRPLRGDWVFIPFKDQRLVDLHLVRTGGTIESQREAGRSDGLKPSGDFVWKYMNDALCGFFLNAHRHDLFTLDSSNMSFEEWAAAAREIESIGVAKADTRFEETVRPVFANPLFTTKDYRAQFAACGPGAVFAGYGGGNANILEDSHRSVLPAMRQSIAAGTFVAVTSQVPLEPYDAEYETGISLLEVGGVPCGDLPLADAQVKLSYILGHLDEVERAAAENGLDPHVLTAAAFLSGVAMRKALGVTRFKALMEEKGHPFRVLHEDAFVSRGFESGLRSVVEALRG